MRKYIKYIFIAFFIVLAGLVLLTARKKIYAPEIVSVRPVNGQENVSLDSNVQVYFKDDVPEINKMNFRVRFLPGVPGSLRWQSNNILEVRTGGLSGGTVYEMEVFYKDKSIYKLTFKTVEAYSIEDLKEMTEMALDVKEDMDKLLKEYPWFPKLPVVTDQFVIVYDFEKQSFRIRLKMPSSSLESSKSQAIQRAREAIKEIGGDENNYHILYEDSTP